MSDLLNKLFVAKTDKLFLQLFRYGFVGGLAFIVDYISLYIFTEYLAFHHLASAAIAFVLGLIVNYALSSLWVFSQHKQGNKFKEFLIFSVIGVIGLGLNELFIYVGTDILGMFYMLSKLISTAFVFMWNFLARRALVFKV